MPTLVQQPLPGAAQLGTAQCRGVLARGVGSAASLAAAGTSAVRAGSSSGSRPSNLAPNTKRLSVASPQAAALEFRRDTGAFSSLRDRMSPSHTSREQAREESPPPQRYKFFGLQKEIFIHEGLSTLTNTGWRVWRGSYTVARYLERIRPNPNDWEGLSLLDLSCGAGLAGIALSQVCADVTLTEMPENIEAVRRNLAANVATGGCREAAIVPYTWGQLLPPELQRRFDIVFCADLLYEVFHRRLDAEFHSTLRELVQRQRHGAKSGCPCHEVLFCFQVRATPQERRILSDLAARLDMEAEELEIGELSDGFGGLDCCKADLIGGLNCCKADLMQKMRLVRFTDKT